MSFLPLPQLNELAGFARIADKEARSDLALRFIKDENDYTSNFTGALRRIINSNSRTGLSATSFLLSHSEERQTGADAAIIVSKANQSKVAVFEGKWPRFATAGYNWDYAQTATGLSHFSDQLDRQQLWRGTFAIFEMFYCEFPFRTQPSFFNHYGSSCVWHDDADTFKSKRTTPTQIWTQGELAQLLQNRARSIAAIIRAFTSCHEGTPIGMADPEGIGREFRLPRQVLAIRAAPESNDRVDR